MNNWHSHLDVEFFLVLPGFVLVLPGFVLDSKPSCKPASGRFCL